MPFDRAAARASGYTDQEIDAYLARRDVVVPANGLAESRVPADFVAPGSMGREPMEFPGEDEPLEADPFSPLDLPAALSGGGALFQVARGGLPVAGRVLTGTGRALGRRVLGKGNFDDLLREVMGRGRPAAREALGSAEGRVAQAAAGEPGRVVGKIEPKAKPARPSRKKPRLGSAESRVKTQAPDEVAAARAKAREQAGGKSQAMRGASKPALERRASARGKAVGTNDVDDLTKILEQSLEVEAKMAKESLAPAERAFVRRGVREGGRPGPVVKGTAESRIAGPSAEPSRHEVQYYSESQGKFIPIETMHIAQLKNAMNKLHRKLVATSQPSPVTRKQFEALRDEVTHRLQEAGELTIY